MTPPEAKPTKSVDLEGVRLLLARNLWADRKEFFGKRNDRAAVFDMYHLPDMVRADVDASLTAERLEYLQDSKQVEVTPLLFFPIPTPGELLQAAMNGKPAALVQSKHYGIVTVHRLATLGSWNVMGASGTLALELTAQHVMEDYELDLGTLTPYMHPIKEAS